MRNKRGIRDTCGLPSRNDVDVSQANGRFCLFGKLSYDIFALFGERKNFTAIDVDRRNATGDKDKRLLLAILWATSLMKNYPSISNRQAIT